MPEYTWPPMETRKVIGKRISRVDGPAKASGRAKYASDFNRKDVLFGFLVGSPYAHCRVKSTDDSAAKSMKGVTAIDWSAKPGTELQWQGQEVFAVAAETEELAREAARLIKVEYEVLPHLVREDDLAAAGKRAKASGETVTGDPDNAFKGGGVVHEAHYEIPVLTHCCLEPHGQTVEWKGDQVNFWPSTQAVSTVGGDLAQNLGVPESNVHVDMQNVGGGFGSKFSADNWGVMCARLSKASGGRPVKMHLDRDLELMVAGNRPSGFADIKVVADKNGKLVAWQSKSWATGGMGGGGAPPIPYVFTNIPNVRLNHNAVATNCGGSRAWRAPNHPQASYLTCSALDDLAAKLNMDPMEFFDRNFDLTPRADTYRWQIRKAAELMDWKGKWKPRGSSPGAIKTGLGLALCTWGGGGHNSNCQATINPDGTVVIELGTQDLGVGARTIIMQVAAETYGLPLEAIDLRIGKNSYPTSGPSGGSTTSGGVSSSTLKATVNALEKLFEAAAPSLGTTPDKLQAIDGRIQVKGDPSKALSWKQACAKLGVTKIQEKGYNDQKKPGGLNTSGVGGIHMAEVSVDTETGLVKMKKFVAVQDVGLVLNPKLAESQMNGAAIMGICGALMEERVMDQQTGLMLNADMEFYKLAGIGDVGEIISYVDVRPETDKRGVIGIGEPCAVGVVAAIANAVTNAIGVRPPRVPLTADRVLAALERRA
jgi:xanthine dehydrogenase YagR molybdenum-binding subunit